jgi:hypothetical protein
VTSWPRPARRANGVRSGTHRCGSCAPRSHAGLGTSRGVGDTQTTSSISSVQRSATPASRSLWTFEPRLTCSTMHNTVLNRNATATIQRGSPDCAPTHIGSTIANTTWWNPKAPSASLAYGRSGPGRTGSWRVSGPRLATEGGARDVPLSRASPQPASRRRAHRTTRP